MLLTSEINKKEKIFRHEYKYVCSEAQLIVLQNRINTLLNLDMHVETSGSYTVRSVYFDDYYNSCFYKNENGTNISEKFRIRTYNCDLSGTKLELKKKERGKVQKISCPLTQEQCFMLINNQVLPDNPEYPAVLQKLCLLMKTKLLRPVIIVQYNRTPFVGEEGNVRITFDRNIVSSDSVNCFMMNDIQTRPIMPLNQHILEIKWDEFIPDYIHRVLNLENLHQTAFSKFYLSRKFSLKGSI